MDPAKLKVTELRAELAARGLDTKGVKAVLVNRLKEALEEETGQEVPDTSIVDTSTEETSLVGEKGYQSESEPEQAGEPEEDSSPEQDKDQSPEQSCTENKSPSTEREQTPEEESIPEPDKEPTPEPNLKPSSEQEQPLSEVKSSPQQSEEDSQSQDVAMDDVAVKKEPINDDFKQQNYEERADMGYNYQGYDDRKENYEADVKMEPGVEVKEEKPFQSEVEEKKRKRSRSPEGEKQGWGKRQSWGRKEDEPDLDDNEVVLGWYDSDLNLEISKTDFLEASPMSKEGFGYIWAGCRATFGYDHGKVCYEVMLLENHDVTHLEDEPSPHVLRVGFSTLSTSMLLGEEPMSFGYGGTAKTSTNCKFTTYGTTFVVGDTVTAYLDYGERVKISFSVNGQYQREAFNIPASQINNQPLFPHLLSKNIKFQVNFGQRESQLPLESGFTWCCKVPLEERVAGPRRPEKREDCEMLMMCGLPGCGKTTWANAYVQEHPDKFYNILGTNNLIDKMKIQGLPRKRNYHGRWDVLIDKCTKCLNKLLEMASRRRRNYILDQTNVYPSAQKRKMRNFVGFIRRAIVIVPTDEEFQKRCAKREAEEGKDIPDSAVLEMKANFRLPEEGEHFDEIRYIELNEEESRPLVEQYNKEGRSAGYGKPAPFSGGDRGGDQGKKFHSNDRPPFRGGDGGGRGGGFRGGRGGGFGGMRDRQDDRGPRGGRGGGFRGPPMKGGMDRGGRGGWQPRGSDRGGGGRGGGGWRDRSPQSFDRDGDNRAPGGGPWRNNRSNERDRPYDRNQRGGGRGGRGGFDRENMRENDFGGNRGGGGFREGGDFNRGGGGYDRDDFSRGGGGGGGFDRDQRGGGFNRDRGGGRGGRGGNRGGGGGFDRDQRGGGGRGGYDRNRGGGYSDRRGGGGGGNRDGSFDRNRGGSDRGGPRDNKAMFYQTLDPLDSLLIPNIHVPPPINYKGGNSNQGNQGQGWGNNQSQGGGYNQGGWGQQGYNNQQQQQPQQQGGYNQVAAGYNQSASGYNQGNQGYNAQQQQQTQQTQQGWGQQGWGNKGYGTASTQQQTPSVPQAATATPAAATGYNTAAYNQTAGYNQTQAQTQYQQQGYWGQYGYGQGWTQNADGTYSYPQGWQYGYNYGQTAGTAMTPGQTATAAAPAAVPNPMAK